VLGPAVPAPQAPEPRDADERRAFLARLAALAGCLRFHGLGIAPGEVWEIGAQPGEPGLPALAGPPVPVWRGAAPALAVAAAAIRCAGRARPAGGSSDLRIAVERALDRGLPRDVADDVVTALRAVDSDGRPESLAAEFARRAGSARPAGRELSGLAFPGPFVTRTGGEGAWAAVGRAALWLARGAARRDEEPAFVECGPGSPLEEGAALRRLAATLGDDVRAAALRALAAGGRVPRREEGPRVAVVALDAERWDPRSRRALAEALPAMGFRVLEACGAALRPWEERLLLGFRLDAGDAAALLYLPFASPSACLEAWREAESGSAADPARFLDAARELSCRFDARAGRCLPERRKAGPRREPVVEAAALLADLFPSAEAAAAAGRPEAEARAALDRAVDAGELVLELGTYRFHDEAERARLASRVPAAARRDAVERLAALDLPAERFAPAALARGDPRDIEAARRLLSRAAGEPGGDRLAAALFARAPKEDRDLGRPLLAVACLARCGRRDLAREAASRLGSAVRSAPLAERFEAARALVKLGDAERALSLCEGGEPREDAARAFLLAELHRGAEARRLLARLTAPELPDDVRIDATLLLAELDERSHRWAAAARGLAEAESLLGGLADPEQAARAARTAGYLANDLGRTEEAIALFRRAGALARDARSRADAAFDVAFAALDGGRLELGARELDEALALYAEAGDDERYLSALGNRVDFFLKAGDVASARPVLARVLAHERASGRPRRLLFVIPAVQEVALLDADGEQAAEAFREAQALVAEVEAPHPAWREVLVFEAERRLGAGDATGAALLAEEAGAIPDNHARTETRRRRLLASARRDLGESAETRDLGADERHLLAAEDALAVDRAPSDPALRVLEALAGGREAGVAVRRILEWSGRFPAALLGPAGPPLLRIGRRAAARAGLDRAEERLAALLGRPDAHETPPAPERGRAVVAEDASTRAVFEEVARIAPSTLALLVRGESGTGKEVVAREAHRLSKRAGPFVPVNLAALPASLAESELFGHARGAFSGADRDRRGLVEESSGGTLFLDEVGDLAPALQGKLLRVLQEGEIRRLGETAVRRVDLRVVAATHRDLPALVDRGEFRGDLYYRIAGHEVVLKPLRERPRDRARLVASALDGKAVLNREAAEAVDRWSWPGNARELLAALESARALAAPSRVLRLEHLPRAVRDAARSPRPAGDYRKSVEDARRHAIATALEASGGRRVEAARRLGISRQSLLYEMKKLKLA
jgi:DNA-binding NtrC family response regulator